MSAFCPVREAPDMTAGSHTASHILLLWADASPFTDELRACLPEALDDRVLLCVAAGVIDMRPHVNKVQALMIAASYQSL